MVKSEVCDEISAFLSFSENLKIRVRISTLGFSEPRKKHQKSIYLICVELLRLHQMILQSLKMDKVGVIKMEMCGKKICYTRIIGMYQIKKA